MPVSVRRHRKVASAFDDQPCAFALIRLSDWLMFNPGEISSLKMKSHPFPVFSKMQPVVLGMTHLKAARVVRTLTSGAVVSAGTENESGGVSHASSMPEQGNQDDDWNRHANQREKNGTHE
jgi:hypothetical protein